MKVIFADVHLILRFCFELYADFLPFAMAVFETNFFTAVENLNLKKKKKKKKKKVFSTTYYLLDNCKPLRKLAHAIYGYFFFQL